MLMDPEAGDEVAKLHLLKAITKDLFFYADQVSNTRWTTLLGLYDHIRSYNLSPPPSLSLVLFCINVLDR